MPSLLEPVVHPRRQVRVWPLPAPLRYVAPNFEVVFPCNSVPLRVERRGGRHELVGGTICLGDWTNHHAWDVTRSRRHNTRVEGAENQLWKNKIGIAIMKISGRTTFGGKGWGRGEGTLTRVTGISRSHNQPTRDFEARSF